MTFDEAGKQLGALLPVEAVHRGWRLANLGIAANGEYFVDVVGPSGIDVTRHAYGGADVRRLTSARWESGVIGRISAYTLEDLVDLTAEMLAAVVGAPGR